MNNKGFLDESKTNGSFEENIDILFHEIDLAIKWARPSILFAVYSSGSVLSKAKAELEDRLTHLNQKTHIIEVSGKKQSNFSTDIFQLPQLSHSVLFIDDIQCTTCEEDTGFFIELRRNVEKFIDHRIRVVFWLSEDDVPFFATNAIDCWILRHHVVEFQDSPFQTKALLQTLESTWLGLDEHAFEVPSSSFAINEIIASPEQVEPNFFHGNLILMLGVLYWRRGLPEEAVKFLNVSLEIARQISNSSLEEQCKNALTLVQADPSQTTDASPAPVQEVPVSTDLQDNQAKAVQSVSPVATDEKTVMVDEAQSSSQELPASEPDIETKKVDSATFESPSQVNISLDAEQETPEETPEPQLSAFETVNSQVEVETVPVSTIKAASPVSNEEIPVIPQDQQVIPLEMDCSQDVPEQTVMPADNTDIPAAMEEKLDQPERGSDMKESDQLFDHKTSAEWNAMGNKFLTTGSYNDAINAYTKAIELAPSLNWPYIKNLASAHYHKGKIKGRLSIGKTDEPDLWEGEDDDFESSAYFNQDNIPQAQRGDPVETDKSLDANPVNDTANGRADLNDTGIQVQADAASTVSNPSDGQTLAQYDSTPIVNDTGELPEGFTAINRADLSVPQSAIELNQLGNFYTNNRDFDKAIAAYQKSIEKDSRFGQPYSNLGSLYYQMGKFENAVSMLKRSLDFLATPEEKAVSWNRLGDVYRRMRDYSSALDAYQKASQINPNTRPVLMRARKSLIGRVAVG